MLALLIQLAAPDTLRIARLETTLDPSPAALLSESPDLAFGPADRPAKLWARNGEDAVILTVFVPDPTPSWHDAVILCLDTGGDRATTPQHDDFQWEFHRVLDSSVVFRGGPDRWRPPRDDPDWRLGPVRELAGWRVRESEEDGGWALELRLAKEYLTSAGGRAPGFALLVYRDSPSRWSTWPAPPGGPPAGVLGARPDQWGVVNLVTP